MVSNVFNIGNMSYEINQNIIIDDYYVVYKYYL